MKKEKQYPLRLRDDWAERALISDTSSEVPTLDENGMADLVCSMARFAATHEGVMNTAAEHCVFAGALNASTEIGSYLSRYIQETAMLDEGDLKKLGLHEGGDDYRAKACRYIARDKGLSFGGFLKFWLDRVEPQSAQSAMLHTGDVLSSLAEKYPEIHAKNGRTLRDAYVGTGFEKASTKLLFVTLVETAQERAMRRQNLTGAPLPQ